MPRPNRDRVMVSFYLSREAAAAVAEIADANGASKADTYRAMIDRGIAAAARKTARARP